MSHSSSPRRGASADSVTARISRLVIWPSCSNSASARPAARGMMRAPGAAATSIATVLRASTSRRSNAAARRGAHALARAAERFQHGQARGAEAGVVSRRASARRRRAVRGQRQHARAGLQMRAHEIERAAVQREQRRLRQRPAEPRRGQAEGGRRRHHQHFLRSDMARQHGADAVHEGIAGGEHADGRARAAPAPPRPPRSNGDGHGRAAPRIERRGQRQMALAAEHDRRAAHEPAGDRAQPVDAVLADADDGQPARRCGSVRAAADQRAPCNASSFSAAPRRRGGSRSAWRRAPISR